VPPSPTPTRAGIGWRPVAAGIVVLVAIVIAAGYALRPGAPPSVTEKPVSAPAPAAPPVTATAPPAPSPASPGPAVAAAPPAATPAPKPTPLDRTAAREGQQSMLRAREAASRADAARMAGALWTRASDLQRQADDALKRQDMDRARSLFQDAETAYRQAGTAA